MKVDTSKCMGVGMQCTPKTHIIISCWFTRPREIAIICLIYEIMTFTVKYDFKVSAFFS